MTVSTRTHTKLLAAIIGGSALVVMGAVTVATQEASQANTVSVQGAGMSLGATATTTTPPAVAPISAASPTVKATFYGKS